MSTLRFEAEYSTIAILNASATDTSVSTDSLSTALVRQITDTSASIESVSTVAGVAAGTTETSVSTDTTPRASSQHVATITSTSVSTDSAVAHKSGTRTVADTTLSVDNPPLGASHAIIDHSNSTESATWTVAGGRSAVDTSTSNDSASAGLAGFTSDISASTDVLTSIMQASSPVADTSTSSDSVITRFHAVTLTVADTSISTDSLHQLRKIFVTDTSTTSDTPTVRTYLGGFTFVRERAPLRLTVQVKTPDGVFNRWAADAATENVPSGISFSTAMPGGFEQFGCTLQRIPNRFYPDLEELSTVRVLGAGGTIAWEGRLESLPNTGGDQAQVNPSGVGFQSHLKDDNSAREIFVDRSINNWQGPSVGRQLQWLTGSPTGSTPAAFPTIASGPSVAPDFYVVNGVAGGNSYPSLVTALQDTWTESQIVEAWYDAIGIPIGWIYVAWQDNGTFPLNAGNWGSGIFISTLDTAPSGGYDQVNPLPTAKGNASKSSTTSDRVFAILQLWNDVNTGETGGKDGVSFQKFWTATGIYGRHGLPTQWAPGDNPQNAAQGVLASDVVNYAVGKWAPKIHSTTGASGTIQPSGFVIPQLTFLDPTTVANMITEAVKYELLDWAVWEGPTFYMNNRGARGNRWQARIGPAKLESAGPDITHLWNGVIVQFTDVRGINRTYGPPGAGTNQTDASLQDPDPTNPVNEAGLRRWALVQMGTSTFAGALKIGQMFLQEQKLRQTAGQASLTGHVQDINGVWWPVWMVRAGDQIRFTDAADTSYRRIVHTNYDDPSKTNSVQLDQPPDSLAAVLARLNVVLQPYGIG